MKSVKIYGKPTSQYEYFKYRLEEFLKRNEINIVVEEINSVDKIISDKIKSIPTLRINGEIDLNFNENDNIEDFIETATDIIISKYAHSTYSKLLVPIDFSEVSMNALQFAKDFARHESGFIELLYVNHPIPMVVNGIVIEDNFAKNDKIERLEKIASAHKAANNSSENGKTLYISSQFLDGMASDIIIDKSKESSIVIMGSTGENDVLKKMMGSVSNRVADKAKCPVLLVPRGAKYKGVKKIVYAYSPTSYDHKAISALAEFGKKYNATIHLVHVGEEGSDYDPENLKLYLEHMHDGVDFVQGQIFAKNVAIGINQYAENLDADLIIISKKKRNIIEELFERSHSKPTILKANIPVMVFHYDDHACQCGGECDKVADTDCSH